MNHHIGIVDIGIYLPSTVMTAAQIAEATLGNWTEKSIKDKLGINKIRLPSKEDGTQEMGVKAAQEVLKKTKIDPEEIDLILCIGEEWKEYPLTTSGIYIQEKIGAKSAWALDVQQRCCSTVSAIKIAKDMMLTDPSLKTTMIVGGYRNGDFIDYADPCVSMMYNLSSGAGAMILKRDYNKNVVLASHIMSDGSMARDAAVVYGGTENPIDQSNLEKAYKSLKLVNAEHMKTRLNEISMKNWLYCIDKALEKSGLNRKNIDYLAVLHFKKSMHEYMLDLLGLTTNQSVYLSDYGHIGQIDQMLSIDIGRKKGLIKNGSHIALVAAGIGYAWACNIVRWGEME